MFERINELILPAPKVVYFSMSMLYYTLFFFRPTFCTKYLGMTKEGYGDAIALMGIVSFLFMTAWSRLADHLARHRLVLVSVALAMGGSFQLLLIQFPDRPTLQYWWSVGILCLFGSFFGGIMPLTDFQVLRMLKARVPSGGAELYGRQRMFGTLSYGITTWFMGILIQHVGLKSFFPCMAIFAALFALLLCTLGESDRPVQEEVKESPKDAEESPKTTTIPIKSVEEVEPKKTLWTPHFIFFLFLVFLMGFARNIMNNFLASFLQETMSLTGNQAGFSVTCSSICSFIIFFNGAWLIRTFGIHWMLVVAQLAVTVRMWIYCFIPHDAGLWWLVYLIETMNGLAFGLTHLSGVKMAAETAPPGLGATAQALYTSMYTQLPVVVCGFAGGRSYQRLGPFWTFFITAIISSAALLMAILKFAGQGKLRFSRPQY